MHPSSQSFWTNTSDWLLMPGITFSSIASLGICGESIFHVCVEVSFDPSGIMM